MVVTPANTSGKTILVVDDDITTVSLLKKILASKGYNVLQAEDGAAALPILASQNVDLLTTGIIMPRLNGHELLETVREKYPALPVVIITCHDYVPTIEKCVSLGIYDYVKKPFKIDAVLEVVRHALLYGDGKISNHAGDAMPMFIEALDHKLYHFKMMLREKNYGQTGRPYEHS